MRRRSTTLDEGGEIFRVSVDRGEWVGMMLVVWCHVGAGGVRG